MKLNIFEQKRNCKTMHLKYLFTSPVEQGNVFILKLNQYLPQQSWRCPFKRFCCGYAAEWQPQLLLLWIQCGMSSKSHPSGLFPANTVVVRDTSAGPGFRSVSSGVTFRRACPVSLAIPRAPLGSEALSSQSTFPILLQRAQSGFLPHPLLHPSPLLLPGLYACAFPS